MTWKVYQANAYSKSKEERTRFLIEYRDGMGMTNQQLADRLHTSRRTVEGWIARKQAPAAVTVLIAEIIRLADRINELNEPDEYRPDREEEHKIMREVIEERLYGAEIKNLM